MTRKGTFAVFIPVVIVMVVIDQVTKAWAASALQLGKPGANLGLFEFELVHNAGAAFGMGQGAGVVLIAIAIIICVFAIAWLVINRQRGVFEVIGLALVVAGGIGNCIDRLIQGYVVDFIKVTFIDFPVFNVADICVTCGVAIFVIALVAANVSRGADATEGGSR